MKETVHKKTNPFLMILGLLPLMASCIMIDWQDISADPRYANTIGRIYKTNAKLGVYGVKPLDTKSKMIAYYFISDSLDISTHGIEPIGCLPQDSLLKISRIVQSNEPIFLGENIEIIVELLNNSIFKRVEEAHLDDVSDMYTKSSGGKYIFILNSKYFTEVLDSNHN